MMTFFKTTLRKALPCLALMVMMEISGASYAAGVGLNKTRVIFSNGERSAALGVNNTSNTPWLVQVGVRDERGQDDPNMVVTPPLFRLEANSQNNLRILSTDKGVGFPLDRESVRYVQVAAIPSSAEAMDTHSQLAVAVSFNIKLFWRPNALPEPGEKAYQNVKYEVVNGGLRACNGSPYYLSFNRLVVNGTAIDLNRAPSMLPPFECVQYPHVNAAKQIRWSMINDYGGDSGWFDSRSGNN